jgi:hypothetical protein
MAGCCRHGHIAEVWDLLKSSLPEWKLPLQEWEKQLLAEQQEQEKKELDSATPHVGQRSSIDHISI